MFGQLALIPLEERIVLDAAIGAAIVAHHVTNDAHGTTIYVNDNATGSVHNGLSWKTAFTDLQSALNKAATINGPVQIDIAQGIYTPSLVYSPTNGSNNPVMGGASGLNDPHLKTFDLPNNTTLEGGFIVSNNGNTAIQSNNSSLTVLNGNLGGGVDVWHVVTAGNDVLKTGVSANLELLTIKNGDAAGPDSGNVNTVTGVVNSLAYSHDSGGGLYARFGSNIDISDVIFDNNSAANGTNPIAIVPGGGAIFAGDPGTTLKIDDSQFLNNSASGVGTQPSGGGGAIDMVNGVSVTVTDSTFTGNTAFRDGGAIRSSSNGSSLIVENSLFSQNNVVGDVPVTGGAISVLNTNLVVEDSSFISNSTDPVFGGGGAILFHTFEDTNSPHTALIDNSLFKNNSAGDIFGGGAILGLGVITNPNSTVTIDNDTFTGNTAIEGGAVHIDSLNSLIENSTFSNNTATVFGGAVSESNLLGDLESQTALTMHLLNDTFTNNSVAVNAALFGTIQFVVTLLPVPGALDEGTFGGGALVNHEDGQLVVDNSTFSKNSVSGGLGGALLNGGVLGHLATPSQFAFYKDTAQISNSQFNSNTSDQSGGAIASEAATGTPIGSALTINDSSFANNSALQSGGAIASIDADSLNVLNSSFLNNQTTLTANAPLGGGAIFDQNTNTILSYDLFVGNDTALLGGAVFFQGFFESSPHTYSIDHSVFKNNNATIGGGAVNVAGILGSAASAVNIQNSTFVNNSGDSGGAILGVNLPVNINQSVFLNNTAFVFGGAVCVNNLIAFGFGVPNIGDTSISNSTFINNTDVGSTASFAQLSVFLAQVFGIKGTGIFGGGAIVVHEDGLATIDHNTFIGNTNLNGDGGAILVGGALFQQLANLSVTGAIGGIATVTNNSFINNTASMNGGAIAVVSAVPRIPTGNPGSVTLIAENNSFIANQAVSNGGALYQNNSNGTVLQNTFIFSSDKAQSGDHSSHHNPSSMALTQALNKRPY